MSRKHAFSSAARIAAVAVALAAAPCASARPSRVVVLHTNDTHTHIDDGRVSFSEIAAEKARLEAAGENVILVDAGDYVQGTALGGLDSGRSAVDIMGAAGYQVATLGNHEFDYGIETMLANAARAKFKTVSCNLVRRASASDAGSLVFPPYAVVTSGAVRVAFVGVTTPTTLVSTKPTTFLDPTRSWRAYDFIAGERCEALYAAVQKAVDEAAAHADYTIVLGHLGISPDCAGCRSTDVIAHTTNFVALVDGHSHSEYTGSRVRNAAGQDVILTQSGSYLGLLGCLVLEDGKCVMAGTIYARGDRDPNVALMEHNLAAAAERQLGVEIAFAPAPLCSYNPGTNERIARKEGCSAGDFAADAVLWYANEREGRDCDIALMNGGNVRADIPKGPVTLKALRTVQPFSGNIGIVEANGRLVLDALEFGVQAVGEGEFGGFLHVAGLKMTVDAAVKPGVRVDSAGSWLSGPADGKRRVRDVQVYDRRAGEFRPLDPNSVYRVAGNAFTLVEGGDGFSMFRSAKVVEEALAIDHIVLSEYAKAFKPGPDGVPAIVSENSPLASLPGYPIDYASPKGSGRIAVKGMIR
jgi:2',3'-cyclic-nucleotide 2'-phosphodiesterase (5'-nucleotidase family)